MRTAARRDQRRQTRPPGCERLVRRRQLGEHGKVLAGAEPVAQALRFLGPDFSKPRPKRLDQIHLVAMLDDAPAQIVQVVSLGI